MKKFLPYILIIIFVLTGLSSLTTSAEAASGDGICKYTEEGTDYKSPEGTPGHKESYAFEREIVVPIADCPYLKVTYYGNDASATPINGNWTVLRTYSSELGTCTYDRISPIGGNARKKITSTTKQGDCPPAKTFFENLSWIPNPGGGDNGGCSIIQGDPYQIGTCNYYHEPATVIPRTAYKHSDTTPPDCIKACSPQDKIFTDFSPSVVCTRPKVLDPSTNKCVPPNPNPPPNPLPPPDTDTGGLVPCTNYCDFNALMALVNKVIKFILYDMVIPIAAIMFVYAGFELVTSGGSTEKRGIAKKVFTNAVIGLIIAVGAFLIIRTILSILGYSGGWIGFNPLQ